MLDDKKLMSHLADKANEQAKQYSDKDFTDYEDKACATEEDVRVKILLQAIDSANNVYDTNNDHEKSKAKWRGFFIVFMSAILTISLGAIGTLLFLQRLETPALIACLSYVVANTIAILFFMIKYVHNDLYLKTFETVTQKLLDYLVEDKNARPKSK